MLEVRSFQNVVVVVVVVLVVVVVVGVVGAAAAAVFIDEINSQLTLAYKYLIIIIY